MIWMTSPRLVSSPRVHSRIPHSTLLLLRDASWAWISCVTSASGFRPTGKFSGVVRDWCSGFEWYCRKTPGGNVHLGNDIREPSNTRAAWCALRTHHSASPCALCVIGCHRHLPLVFLILLRFTGGDGLSFFSSCLDRWWWSCEGENLFLLLLECSDPSSKVRSKRAFGSLLVLWKVLAVMGCGVILRVWTTWSSGPFALTLDRRSGAAHPRLSTPWFVTAWHPTARGVGQRQQIESSAPLRLLFAALLSALAGHRFHDCGS